MLKSIKEESLKEDEPIETFRGHQKHLFNDSIELARDNSSKQETRLINGNGGPISNNIVLVKQSNTSFFPKPAKKTEEQIERMFVNMVKSGDFSNASEIDHIIVKVPVTDKLDPSNLHSSIQHMLEHFQDRPKNCHLWLKTVDPGVLLGYIKDMLLKPDTETIRRSLLRLETRDAYTEMSKFVRDLMKLKEHKISVAGSTVFGSSRDELNPRKLIKAQGSIPSFMKNEAKLKTIRADYLVNFYLSIPLNPMLCVTITYYDKTVQKKSLRVRHQYITIDQLGVDDAMVHFDNRNQQIYDFEVDDYEELAPVTMAYDPILSFTELYTSLSKNPKNVLRADA